MLGLRFKAQQPAAEASIPDAAPADAPPFDPASLPEYQALVRRSAVATAISLALHLLILLLVSRMVVPAGGSTTPRQLESFVAAEEPLDELMPDPLLAVAEPDDNPDQPNVASEAASAATFLASEEVIAPQVDSQIVEDVQIEVPAVEMVSAMTLDDVLTVPGAMGQQVAQAEGAVDRIAFEIATALADSDVLVVWLMDASISLQADRQAVADRLENIYREIDEIGEVRDGALLNAVYRYGQRHAELVEPTPDGEKIVAAIRDVQPDESGIENVFGCVVAAANKYKSYRTRQHRKVMLVILTDESGDDTPVLEDAITTCRKLAIPVYTVGPSSMFGRQQGTQAYKHPENNEIYQLPVDRGPDTVRQEMLLLPFWFEGDQFSNLHAGIGPFAMTRLSRETGGAYFINDKPADRAPFNLEDLRQYLPEYSAPAEYLRAVSKSRLRQAILQAVDLTNQRELKGTPQLAFEPTGATFQQELTEAQRTVAFNLLTLEAALAAFGNNGLEADYQAERSARWRAWYDLTVGRLLAMHVRCSEYNQICATMKGKGADFVERQSNRWQFLPDDRIQSGTAAERRAAEARRLLQRAIDENPGTPWAVLAARELAHPLGFKIEEAYVAPPPAMPMLPDNDPQAPGRSEEQMRRLAREQVQLPKL
jgi:hypothetical protein